MAESYHIKETINKPAENATAEKQAVLLGKAHSIQYFLTNHTSQTLIL
jgi:hypothetical protein